MGLLDDTAIFAAVVSQGGFSHAAKYLGLSNGLISRRIARLESSMGVSLIIRTTRHIKLTPEGELFWQHAKRIQQELNQALGIIQSLSSKPKGNIRISAPIYLGRHYLMPIILQFLNNFTDIKIELILSNQRLDPIKHKVDLLIRSSGYLQTIKESSLRMKPLLKKTIGLYASSDYLLKHGTPKHPQDLRDHQIIGYLDQLDLPGTINWDYRLKGKKHQVILEPTFKCNDIEASLAASVAGLGIGKYSNLVLHTLSNPTIKLTRILTDYDWGDLNLYALYASQQALPKRTRLLLDFIASQIQHI